MHDTVTKRAIVCELSAPKRTKAEGARGLACETSGSVITRTVMADVRPLDDGDRGATMRAATSRHTAAAGRRVVERDERTRAAVERASVQLSTSTVSRWKGVWGRGKQGGARRSGLGGDEAEEAASFGRSPSPL